LEASEVEKRTVSLGNQRALIGCAKTSTFCREILSYQQWLISSHPWTKHAPEEKDGAEYVQYIIIFFLFLVDLMSAPRYHSPHRIPAFTFSGPPRHLFMPWHLLGEALAFTLAEKVHDIVMD
jgi:hypothetical protein